MSTKKVLGTWQGRRRHYASSRDGRPCRGGDRRSLRRISPPGLPPFASLWVATSASCGAFLVRTKPADRAPGDRFRAILAFPSFAPFLLTTSRRGGAPCAAKQGGVATCFRCFSTRFPLSTYCLFSRNLCSNRLCRRRSHPWSPSLLPASWRSRSRTSLIP